MTAFVLKRLGFAVITLFAVLTIVFFIVRILPGDPAMAILGDQASQEALVALRARLGLETKQLHRRQSEGSFEQRELEEDAEDEADARGDRERVGRRVVVQDHRLRRDAKRREAGGGDRQAHTSQCS